MAIGLQINAASMPASGSEKYIQDISGNNSTLSISQGRVGIGTESPGMTLDVLNTTTGNWVARLKNSGSTPYGLLIETAYTDGNRYALDITTAAVTLFCVTDAGNVGIGTASPSAKLEVNGGSCYVFNNGGDPTVLAGDDGSNYVGIQYNSTNNYGLLQSYTANAAGALAINPAGGNVGIGQTSPDRKLEILDASNPQLRLTHTNDSKFTDFTVDTNHDLTIQPSSTGQVKIQPTSDSTDFFQVLDADGGTPVLNVDSTNERVGIGTATPGETLEVNGKLKMDGNIVLNGQYISNDGDNEGINIDNSGKVGIGTTAGGKIFRVYGNQSADWIGAFDNDDNSSNALGVSIACTQSSGTGAALRVNTGGGGVSSLEVRCDGKVAIGGNFNARLDVDGGIKIGNDTDGAGVSKVGTLKYFKNGNNTYLQVCMQSGSSAWEWVTIASRSWS